jgi:hypothetical protein
LATLARRASPANRSTNAAGIANADRLPVRQFSWSLDKWRRDARCSIGFHPANRKLRARKLSTTTPASARTSMLPVYLFRPVPMDNTTASASPCSISAPTHSRAESLVVWPTRASGADCTFATYAGRRASSCGSAAARTLHAFSRHARRMQSGPIGVTQQGRSPRLPQPGFPPRFGHPTAPRRSARLLPTLGPCGRSP